MIYKKYDNGLRVVINKISGMFSVSVGVLVKTGSANESEEENGISHFIEHTVFKGTKNRSSFEISDCIDRIGAQINAFTSKELTCYYTKSTAEHLERSVDVLSDLFFNAVFDKDELEKEKGVIIEEINMSEDSPEDLCLDLLAESFHGKNGLGRTILGTAQNVKRFTDRDVKAYMDKYYTADNVVISVAGNVNVEKTVELVERYFADKFTRCKSAPQAVYPYDKPSHLLKTKKTEQTHIAFALPGVSVTDERSDALSIANIVFGGGMSSRLFQRVREDLGLAYSVYSYLSQYKDRGVIEIYAGVNTSSRASAVNAIVKELKSFQNSGITESEFIRGKEQLKSAFVLGRESTSSQMLLCGKYALFLDKQFDFKERMKKLGGVSFKQVNEVINELFDVKLASTAALGPSRRPINIR